MHKIPTLIASLVLAGGIVQNAHADVGRDRPGPAFGKVLHVKPLYETVAVEVPEQQCWSDSDDYGVGRRYFNGDGRQLAGTLIGGVVGGVLGNQVGGGSGRTVMTIAGTVLGAMAGNRIADHWTADTYQGAGNDQHCTTLSRTQEREELVAYHVKYRYRGRVFFTETDYHPGEWIRVDRGLKGLHATRF
ncbi:MAG: glycine zipper 2TM domain-containing protein [Gammaproteobacteria bacterium]|nr:glycine zipper 2TM domain-containing protein [Gammaproteobacteria bacterium]